MCGEGCGQAGQAGQREPRFHLPAFGQDFGEDREEGAGRGAPAGCWGTPFPSATALCSRQQPPPRFPHPAPFINVTRHLPPMQVGGEEVMLVGHPHLPPQPQLGGDGVTVR